MTCAFVYQVTPEKLYEIQNKLGMAKVTVLPKRSMKNIGVLRMLSRKISNQLKRNNNRGNARVNFMKLLKGKCPCVRNLTSSTFDSLLIKISVS